MTCPLPPPAELRYQRALDRLGNPRNPLSQLLTAVQAEYLATLQLCKVETRAEAEKFAVATSAASASPAPGRAAPPVAVAHSRATAAQLRTAIASAQQRREQGRQRLRQLRAAVGWQRVRLFKELLAQERLQQEESQYRQRALQDAAAVGAIMRPEEGIARLARAKARLAAMEAQLDQFTTHEEVRRIQQHVSETERQAAAAETQAAKLNRIIRRLRMVDLRQKSSATQGGLAARTDGEACSGQGHRAGPAPPVVLVADKTADHGRTGNAVGSLSTSEAAAGTEDDITKGHQLANANNLGVPGPLSRTSSRPVSASGGGTHGDAAMNRTEDGGGEGAEAAGRPEAHQGAAGTGGMTLASFLSADARASKLLHTIASFEALFNRGHHAEAARLATQPGNDVLRTPATWERFNDVGLDKAGAWRLYAEALLHHRASDLEQVWCVTAALQRGQLELVLHWLATHLVHYSRAVTSALVVSYLETLATDSCSINSKQVASLGLTLARTLSSRHAPQAAREKGHGHGTADEESGCQREAEISKQGESSSAGSAPCVSMWEEAFFMTAMGQLTRAMALVSSLDYAGAAELIAAALTANGSPGLVITVRKDMLRLAACATQHASQLRLGCFDHTGKFDE